MPRLLPDAPISPRAWAWWLLATTATLCSAIAMFNVLVDPTAQLGTGLLDPVAAGPRDRTAKVGLLERGTPSMVVLGSSRTKKLDPAWIEPGGENGVNAAVVGGDLFEARVLTAWLADRAHTANTKFPQLVVGIDIEQFRDSSLQGSGFLDVPQLASIARREARGSSGSAADEFARVGRLLLTWQVTKASAASLRARTGGGVATTVAPAARGDEFTDRGVPRADAAWFGAAAKRLSLRTPAAVAASMDEYRRTYASIGKTLDPDAREDLRALVRIAREAGGPPPLLYVTPSHPRFASTLDPKGREARHRAVLRLLRTVARGGRAVVLDCSRCIDGSDDHWIDSVHPSPVGARQLAARLAGSIT